MTIPYVRWIPLLTLPLASCIFVVGDADWDGSHAFHSRAIRGSGVRAEADRAVDEFRAIELETHANVQVRVGEAPAVHLAGDDNLLDEIETTVEDGVLSIGLERSANFRCGLEVVISTPSLERFTIEGSGDVQIEGLAADHLKLAIEGSGALCAKGTAKSLLGSIDGSGELNLAELEAGEADLSIEGSGAMQVHVLRDLHYSIEGSGDIDYIGEPQIGGRIEGSGNIARAAETQP